MSRTAVLAAALALAATAAPAAAQEGLKNEAQEAFTKALGKAQSLAPGGMLVKGRTESKGGGIVFGFYFWVNGKLREIEIGDDRVVKDTDKTGDEVSKDVADLIAAKGRARAKLPDGRLLEIAGGALRGAPINRVTYVRDGDRLLMQVGTLVIDATTGQIVTPAAP